MKAFICTGESIFVRSFHVKCFLRGDNLPIEDAVPYRTKRVTLRHPCKNIRKLVINCTNNSSIDSLTIHMACINVREFPLLPSSVPFEVQIRAEGGRISSQS